LGRKEFWHRRSDSLLSNSAKRPFCYLCLGVRRLAATA
jgi:hypothetical protein